MATAAGELTLLLGRLKDGDRGAFAERISIVYKQLRRPAGYCIRQQRVRHTFRSGAWILPVAGGAAPCRLTEQGTVHCRGRPTVKEMGYLAGLTVEGTARVFLASPRTVNQAELKGRTP